MDNSYSAIRQPIKYHLKLGLKGWSVRQTLLIEPASASDHQDILSPMITSDLPSQQSVDHGCSVLEAAAQSITQCLAHLRNPEVEENEQAFKYGLHILHSRLLGIGFGVFQIRTSPMILKHVFSREHLSLTCGGNAMETFPRVNKCKVNFEEFGRFMCLNLLYNPHAPQHPGAPGLFYALRDPSRWPDQHELVFSRYGPNRWNFMGIYQITQSEALSAEEFKSLGKVVQLTWFDNIWNHKWGDYTLAAIYLRQLQGGEPTKDQVREYAKKASLVRRNVSRNDVKQAFYNGDEKINVWLMKCIGYDQSFKRRLIPAAAYNLRSTRHMSTTAKSCKKRQTISSGGGSRPSKRQRH